MTGPRGARDPVLVVLGPTASGKTAVAIELARRLNGEIISADSRAFFVGLDIVTDKPSLEERDGIPHHLLDCVPIDGTYDAMSFRADVVRLLPEIRGRNRFPIIVGGGTLYLGAILRGLFEGPDRDDVLRTELKTRPLNELYAELESVDPPAARRIHRNDRLRITRALEVFQTTGKPMSDWQSEAEPLPEAFRVMGLWRERAEHRVLIETRIRQMLEQGVFEEIRSLCGRGLSEDVQAYRTIGVPEAIEVLEGRMSPDEYVRAVSHRTWQLVRRQMAWFRREDDVHWIRMTGRAVAGATDDILRFLQSAKEGA
jgi:tRNA dimethylallyltransferase